MARAVFPFAAIVGQEDMKLALLIAAVDQGVGGVLVFGDRGTGKSTAVRALADLLPPMKVMQGCRYSCDPAAPDTWCADCRASREERAGTGSREERAGVGSREERAGVGSREERAGKSDEERAGTGKSLGKGIAAPVPVVDLPLGATEDRVVGALDLERALTQGVKAFEPGLLARANRGFLYIDEVNLLEDHLVDLLLDVAASGENVVEREGLSIRHPARFVLIGSGNPEEGELRPQLLDRFGLSVEVTTPRDLPSRIEVVRRRDRFERDPAAFGTEWAKAQARVRRQIATGRSHLPSVDVPDPALEQAARLCMQLGTDGLRGELTLIRAARALAALDGDTAVADTHLRRVAPMALGHRLRRNPLDEAAAGARVGRAVEALFGA